MTCRFISNISTYLRDMSIAPTCLCRALRCGTNCEVMEPPEFRAKWVEEIGRMGELAGNRLFPDVNVIYAHNHDLVVQ